MQRERQSREQDQTNSSAKWLFHPEVIPSAEMGKAAASVQPLTHTNQSLVRREYESCEAGHKVEKHIDPQMFGARVRPDTPGRPESKLLKKDML